MSYKKPSSGYFCTFTPIDSQWAEKAYAKEGWRDEAFENQTRLARYGLAPETKGNPYVNAKGEFCYVTEIVEVLVEGPKDWGLLSDGDLRYCKAWDMIRETREKLLARGWNMGDPHFGNWGFKNKMLIPIDFY